MLATSFSALHGTLGSYLRDALQEGSADFVPCLLFLRAYACGGPSSLFFLFCLLGSNVCFVRNYFFVHFQNRVAKILELTRKSTTHTSTWTKR
jgi:hypothetical protein